MPTPIGQVFNDLALKAGIAVDNPALKTLLASPELATIQVPDELVTGIDNGLLNIEAAKNNHPDIKKKYFADAYDGMDKQLLALIATDTFDQADIDEIKAEKSTSKKQELIISKLKAISKTAKGADKDEVNKQLAIAHAAAKAANDKVEAVTKDYESKIANIQLRAAIKAVFGNYKTIYDEIPGDSTGAIRSATMEAIINKGLQDKNAELRTDENGNLILVGKDGSNVFGANHVHLTPQSFLDQTFAPILKVSGPPKPAAKPNGSTVTPAFKVDEAAEATVSQINSHNSAVIEQLGKPQAALI